MTADHLKGIEEFEAELWKIGDNLGEKDAGSVAAETLLNGMLARGRLLDLVENFIPFDESKPGATPKVVAHNHQVLGVNQAVASVRRQDELKAAFPPGERLRHGVVELPLDRADEASSGRRRRRSYHDTT